MLVEKTTSNPQTNVFFDSKSKQAARHQMGLFVGSLKKAKPRSREAEGIVEASKSTRTSRAALQGSRRSGEVEARRVFVVAFSIDQFLYFWRL